MNTIRFSLNPIEAIGFKSGYLIMRDKEPLEIQNLNCEAIVRGEGIEGCIAALERFKGTKGIESINIEYKII